MMCSRLVGVGMEMEQGTNALQAFVRQVVRSGLRRSLRGSSATLKTVVAEGALKVQRYLGRELSGHDGAVIRLSELATRRVHVSACSSRCPTQAMQGTAIEFPMAL